MSFAGCCREQSTISKFIPLPEKLAPFKNSPFKKHFAKVIVTNVDFHENCLLSFKMFENVASFFLITAE